MATLPPSPFTDSAAIVERPADEAVASPPQPRDAAADLSEIDCIGEIFAGAAKLEAPRFVLDIERFMAELDEPPLFLRQAV